MDILAMNNLWIKHCHEDADFIWASWFDINTTNNDRVIQFNYLIAIGLFESAWLFYDEHKMHKLEDDFGYP